MSLSDGLVGRIRPPPLVVVAAHGLPAGLGVVGVLRPPGAAPARRPTVVAWLRGVLVAAVAVVFALAMILISSHTHHLLMNPSIAS